MKIHNFTIIRTLKTKNNFEKKYLAINNITNQKVAIKEYNITDIKTKIAFLRDLSVKIESEYFPKLLDYFLINNYAYIIREFIVGIDLKSIYSNFKFYFKRNKIFLVKVIIEVLNALKILHSNNLIHRDIRPANIILKTNTKNKINFQNPKISLIDFDTVYNPNLEITDNYSPYALVFSPPEQILRLLELINCTTDIYAVGMMFWVLLNNRLPFNHKIPEIVANLQVTYNLQKTGNTPQKLFEIIKKATYKVQLKKSHNKYTKNEKIEIVKSGQSKRYAHVDEMINDLLNL
jgi:serine/threonine-protein kinase